MRSYRERSSAALIPIAIVGLGSVVMIPITLHAATLRDTAIAGFRGAVPEIESLFLHLTNGLTAGDAYRDGFWIGALGRLLIGVLLAGGVVRSVPQFRNDPRIVVIVSVFAAHIAGIFTLFLAWLPCWGFSSRCFATGTTCRARR